MTVVAECQNSARRRVVVIDDHGLVRRGLISLINSEPGLLVCAEANSYQTGLAAISEFRPDLVTVDISLGENDGLELIKDIHSQFPDLPMLVISLHDEAVYAERTLRAGASGYVAKEQLDETVLQAIHSVLAGEKYMSPALTAWFANQYLTKHRRKRDSSMSSLTDRELEVFELIGRGLRTREIAKRLQRSVKTVESYREHLKSKLMVNGGAELNRLASIWVETGKLG